MPDPSMIIWLLCGQTTDMWIREKVRRGRLLYKSHHLGNTEGGRDRRRAEEMALKGCHVLTHRKWITGRSQLCEWQHLGQGFLFRTSAGVKRNTTSAPPSLFSRWGQHCPSETKFCHIISAPRAEMASSAHQALRPNGCLCCISCLCWMSDDKEKLASTGI